MFAFRSCGPGSIPTSGSWDFSAPCDTFILTISRLGLLPVIFRKFVALLSELVFRSITLDQMDRFSPNFVYAFILTISGLRLLPVIFRKFVALLSELVFSFNNFRSNGQIFTQFCICIYIDNIWVAIVTCHFYYYL